MGKWHRFWKQKLKKNIDVQYLEIMQTALTVQKPYFYSNEIPHWDLQKIIKSG